MKYTVVSIAAFLVVIGGGSLLLISSAREKTQLHESSTENKATSTTSVSEKRSTEPKESTADVVVTAPQKKEAVATTTQSEEKPEAESVPVPTTFTTATLVRYDGTDTALPILIAYEGNVYDVTPGKDFYEPGAIYHFLAGTDGTELLKRIGGETIKKKYKIIGTFTP